MKLTTISEAVTAHSAMAVLLTKMNSMIDLYRSLPYDADRWFSDHEMKFVKRLIGTKKAKWFIENYLGHSKRGYGLKEALYELSRTIHDEHLDALAQLAVHAYKSEALEPEQRTSANFKRLEAGLPSVVAKIANRFQKKDLLQSVKSLEGAMREWQAHLSKLEATEAEEAREDQPIPEPRENLLGQQAAAAEQAVNATLERVPAKYRGDIRNTIARSPNKLLALHKELMRLGIKLAEGVEHDPILKRVQLLTVELARTLAQQVRDAAINTYEKEKHTIEPHFGEEGGYPHKEAYMPQLMKSLLEDVLEELQLEIRQQVHRELEHIK